MVQRQCAERRLRSSRLWRRRSRGEESRCKLRRAWLDRRVRPSIWAATWRRAYTPAEGYGWLDGTIGEAAGTTGTDLTQDLNYTTGGTFALDVADGQYEVTLTAFDADATHDQLGYYLEGSLVDTVTLDAGTLYRQSFMTTVSDGQLTLGLLDLGGADPYVVISGLEIVRIT